MRPRIQGITEDLVKEMTAEKEGLVKEENRNPRGRGGFGAHLLKLYTY